MWIYLFETMPLSRSICKDKCFLIANPLSEWLPSDSNNSWYLFDIAILCSTQVGDLSNLIYTIEIHAPVWDQMIVFVGHCVSLYLNNSQIYFLLRLSIQDLCWSWQLTFFWWTFIKGMNSLLLLVGWCEIWQMLILLNL